MVIRAVQLPPSYTIPLDLLERQISPDCSSSIPTAYEKTGLISHVLLAACMRGQFAVEMQGRGAFTTALLTLLGRERYDRLTYQDVIMRLSELPL